MIWPGLAATNLDIAISAAAAISASTIVPSVISLLSIELLLNVTVPVALRSVTVAGAAVVPPIVVPSIVPPLISAVLAINPLVAIISRACVPEIITFPLPASVTRLLPFIYTSVRVYNKLVVIAASS